MPSISTPMSVFMEEYSRRNPPGPMDSKIIVNEDPENLFTSFLFGPKYMAATMYQLSPPEDLTLATMLVRPGRQFLDEITSEDMITEKNYGSVSRVFIVSKEDISLMADFEYWMIERSPGVEVKEIEGADHMVMLSKPKELCNLLLEVAATHSMSGSLSNPLLVLPLQAASNSSPARSSEPINSRLGSIIGSCFQDYEASIMKKLQKANEKRKNM